MGTPVVHDRDGQEIGEGMLDALSTVLCAIHDLNRDSGNSVTGSIYVVEPKMHGPDEVAFICSMMDQVEDTLGLPRHTVKIGIMDEERRTTVNLKECIRAARHRVAFIKLPMRIAMSTLGWPAVWPERHRSVRACGRCPTGWRRC